MTLGSITFASLWALLLTTSLWSQSVKIAVPQEKDWEKVDEDDGIAVYRSRQAEGDIFSFRGTGIVEAPLTKLIALMSDPTRMPEWVFNCKEAELIERNFKVSDRVADPSAHYQMFYGVAAVPWPLNDRDYILKAQISYQQQPGKALPQTLISMRSVSHPQKPVHPDRVRMPVMESLIVLSPEGSKGERTLVDFSVTTNPGGVIPAWITKLASREIPQKTLLKMREMAKSTRYDKDFEELVLYYAKPI